MERVGIDLNSCAVKFQYVNSRRGPFDFDVAAYVISENIHRRHLSKQERADLIVKAIKAGQKPPQHEAVSKGGRGKRNPVKEKAVAAGKAHGISKATVERAIAKAEGKTPKRRMAAPIEAARRAYLLACEGAEDLDAERVSYGLPSILYALFQSAWSNARRPPRR